MRISYTYQSYSNCPRATEYSKKAEANVARASYFVSLLSIGAAITFLYYTFSFFGTYDWNTFLGATVFVVVTALLDFYHSEIRPNNIQCKIQVILTEDTNKSLPTTVVTKHCECLRKENKKQNIEAFKKFFPIFLASLVDAIALMATIKGVYFLCHKEEGLTLLFGGIATFFVFSYCIWRLVNGSSEKLKDICNDSRVAAESVPDMVGQLQNRAQPTENIANKPPSHKFDIYTLDFIASICFYVGIIGFLILLIKMAPGVDNWKIISYVVIAAITIVAAFVVNTLREKKFTYKRQLIALAFGLLLLIPAMTLRVVYECKVDATIADIPNSGFVYVKVKLDEEFYSKNSSGMIRRPYSYITIDGDQIDGKGTLKIELNKRYLTKIGAGHDGLYGEVEPYDFGSKNKNITFTQNDLLDGLTITEKVSLKNGYANVTVEFERVCTFWEVIFYKPF